MTGRELNAYVVSGAVADHECATPEEAEEKISKGMYVLLREGSASHDLKNLAPAVNDGNFRRFALCTDDRHADGLAEEGHIDHVLRTAVKSGISGERAVVMCTLNAAECFGLKGKGAVAPATMPTWRCSATLKTSTAPQCSRVANLWRRAARRCSGVKNTFLPR